MTPRILIGIYLLSASVIIAFSPAQRHNAACYAISGAKLRSLGTKMHKPSWADRALV